MQHLRDGLSYTFNPFKYTQDFSSSTFYGDGIGYMEYLYLYMCIYPPETQQLCL